MLTFKCLAFSVMLLWPFILARSSVVPSNVKNFYNGLVRNKTCINKLEGGFYNTEDGENSFSYCGDHKDDLGIIYLQGRSGNLADMDIDCDGEIQDTPEKDGRCGHKYAPEREDETAFRDTIKRYRAGIDDLDPYIHSWIVFGNDGRKNRAPSFDPTHYNIFPLSIIAVVCNNKLLYGVWGDTNGGGDKSMVGEASLSLATAFFGHSMNGNNGHEQNDCLYISFTGADAVPGRNGAAWGAKTWMDFHESIAPLGDKLIRRIPGAGNWSRPALRKMQADE